MPISSNNRQQVHVQHVPLDRDGWDQALRSTLERLERDTPAVGRSFRRQLVRRMTDAEVARLHLEPAAGTWLEVRIVAETSGRVGAGSGLG